MAIRPIDDAVEHSSRSLAGRYTRRSVLGRAGQAAVVVAGGPALAVMLAEEAEARVCGQSGVAPKCPTYDCDHTWGWCWYASGCCTDGLLKKICDCCAPNTPHPVGYCPSGTRVFCIVESCGTDPRVQRKPITTMPTDDSFELLGRIRRFRFPNGSPTAVFGSDQSLALASVAFPVASIVDGPIHLVPRTELLESTLAEIERAGVRHVVAVGPSPDDGAVARHLTPRGISFTRIGASEDPSALSLEVAAWAAGRGVTGLVGVGLSDAASITPPLSLGTGLASRARLPIVIGTAAIQAAVDGSAGITWQAPPTAHLLGQEAATVPLAGAVTYVDASAPALAERVNTAAAALGGSAICPVFASSTSPTMWASAHLGQPLVVHDPATPRGRCGTCPSPEVRPPPASWRGSTAASPARRCTRCSRHSTASTRTSSSACPARGSRHLATPARAAARPRPAGPRSRPRARAPGTALGLGVGLAVTPTRPGCGDDSHARAGHRCLAGRRRPRALVALRPLGRRDRGAHRARA
jgi:hypothetical protein